MLRGACMLKPGLAEQPASRWDRLVAVLEDVDPERVIDASHIIERERKVGMTDLELFYVLGIRYQNHESRVLAEVLNLYVLISTWLEWLQQCDVCLTARRTGRPPHAVASALGLQAGGSECTRLHPETLSSNGPSFTEDRGVTASERSLAGASIASTTTTTYSPLTRTNTWHPSATLAPGGLEADPWPAGPGMLAGGAQPRASPRLARSGPTTFLSRFTLPTNWAVEGSVDFTRDARVLCELLEEVVSLAPLGGEGGRRSVPCETAVRAAQAEVDPRFPSLADVERVTSRGGVRSGSGNSLDQLAGVPVTRIKPRGSRGKTSRVMRMMEMQSEVVRRVSRLNELCELYLHWDPQASGGEPFFSPPTADRLVRPLNGDDAVILQRLHWFAVRLYTRVNDSAVVPPPPPLSFLVAGVPRPPQTVSYEEMDKLEMLIATQSSCLPHNSKVELIVTPEGTLLVSHPTARREPLTFDCYYVEGEVFVYVDAAGVFVPLWALLKHFLREWDHVLWDFELPVMEERAEKVLRTATTTGTCRPVPAPPSTATTAPFLPAGGGGSRGPSGQGSVSKSGPLSAADDVQRARARALSGVPDSSHTAAVTAAAGALATSQSVAAPAHQAFNLTITGSSVRRNRSMRGVPSQCLSPSATPLLYVERSGRRGSAARWVASCEGPSFPDMPSDGLDASASPAGCASPATALRSEAQGPARTAPPRVPMADLEEDEEEEDMVGFSTASSRINAERRREGTRPPPPPGAESRLPRRPTVTISTATPVGADASVPHGWSGGVLPGSNGAAYLDDCGDDTPTHIPTATLSAAQPRPNQVSPRDPTFSTAGGDSDRGGSQLTTYDETDEPSQSSTKGFSQVKSFSATVVHESADAGIVVRDHKFRVSGRPVGKGAFGAVYRALDLDTGVIVAVKQSRYSVDCNHQDNLNLREFQMWSKLPHHPNVITFHGASREVETRQLLLVLEFASGGSILTMYENYRPIPEHLFFQHAWGIASGLKHLHDHNVIHGDMKPVNVLTRSDGSVAITDFGCSRLTRRAVDGVAPSQRRCSGSGGDVAATVEEPETDLWPLLGTAAYMAPEVIANEPDFKSDVWAYACTLLHLWLGESPWSEGAETEHIYEAGPLIFYIGTHKDAVPYTGEQLARAPRWAQRIARRAFVGDVESRASMTEILAILVENSDGRIRPDGVYGGL